MTRSGAVAIAGTACAGGTKIVDPVDPDDDDPEPAEQAMGAQPLETAASSLPTSGHVATHRVIGHLRVARVGAARWRDAPGSRAEPFQIQVSCNVDDLP